ncbi:virB8 family protein [Sphingomonas phyllosphaerae]|uniref:virB8 family protein n=1 Tax=Sphingomonas phyllosphaerae TaxID=257003 RepID=UPI0003B5A613|nr:VirB8/TrbF family protein [Sphingomonas phyllosphaerae]
MSGTKPGDSAAADKRSGNQADKYFAQAGSWAQDGRDALVRSRRNAWLIATAATVIAVCEAFALLVLMPLKTVVPYTLLVDRQTGFVQELKPLDAQTISPDRALTQSFLVQYVIAREGFDYTTVQSDYRKVGLWSTGAARADYIAAMQASSPDSPLARLPRSTTLDVQVKSVTALANGAALVRYDKRRRDAGGVGQPAQPWVAVIQYGFSGEPLSVADRFINPLGFQVRRYRRSQEAVPAPEPAFQPSEAREPGPGGMTSPQVSRP